MAQSGETSSAEYDFTYVEEEVEYSYEEKDWFTTFKRYHTLYKSLFNESYPYSGIMLRLVHGQKSWPRDEDVRCALRIIEGRSEDALGLLPLDPGRRSVMLHLACLAGDAEVSRALLVEPQFHVTMDHLEAAIDIHDWEIVEQLLNTGDLDDYVDLEDILRTRVPQHVLTSMGRTAPGSCTIL